VQNISIKTGDSIQASHKGCATDISPKLTGERNIACFKNTADRPRISPKKRWKSSGDSHETTEFVTFALQTLEELAKDIELLTRTLLGKRSSAILGGGMAKALIHHRGEMWPRNIANINAVLGSKEGGQGIYILFDGSTPVYVGRGNIRQRVRQARKSKRRGQSWDHFSWYVVPNADHEQELEALLLRMLPPHLRTLNRQRGKLKGATRHDFKHDQPDPIKRPNIFGRAS
jgi:hypothetical protein